MVEGLVASLVSSKAGGGVIPLKLPALKTTGPEMSGNVSRLPAAGETRSC